MIKFNLGGNKGSNTNNPPNSNAVKTSNKKLFSGTSTAMPNLSGINMGFSNITKKMGEGFSNIPNLAAVPASSQEKKIKDEAQEKKGQIAAVIDILEDVYLQCPPYHSGLILAYTGKNMSPIMSPGIKFTWFRMKGEDPVEQIEETNKSWYSPSLDDIGAMICVQCEDNYEQGYSKYLECGPLRVDPLVKSVSESAINSGSYEAKEVFVSMGLSAFDQSSYGVNGSFEDIQSFPTALSKDHAFVQLSGQSTIEVDNQGIFISIPTMPIKGKGGKSTNNSNTEGTSRSSLITARRGLRVPANGNMKLVYVQPSSIVLSIPVKRKTVEDTSTAPMSPPMSPAEVEHRKASRSLSQDQKDDATSALAAQTTDNQHATTQLASNATEKATAEKEEAEEEKMRQFLTSSILAIPWSYEGHSLSPAAYIADHESKLSPEERERLLKEAEEDSIVFAQTVVLLAEFISSVPETTEEILICFSCEDKMIRDLLGITMKVFTCFPEKMNRYDRLASSFPWLLEDDPREEDGRDGRGGSHRSSHHEAETLENELKKHLKSVEEENSSLKKERNELTKQLLQAREEIAVIRAKGFSAPAGIAAEHAEGAAGLLTVSSVASLEDQNVLSQHGLSADLFSSSTAAGEELSTKIIELETKLNILTKKEVEATKARTDAETKNAKLTADIDRYKRINEELKVNHNTLQVVSDRQENDLQSLQEELAQKDKLIKNLQEKVKDYDQISLELENKNQQIQELEKTIKSCQDELANHQNVLDSQLKQRESLRNEFELKLKQKDSAMSSVESQLSQQILENKRQDVTIYELREQIKAKDIQCEEMAKYQKMYEEELSKNDQLNAQINHLIKKSESQTRDLKKTMNDNAQALAEFEKALIRKSEECNELYFKINAMKDAEAARLAAEQQASNNSATAFISKFSSSLSGSGHNAQDGSNDQELDMSTANSSASGSGRKRSNSNAGAAVTGLFRRLSASASSVMAGNNLNNNNSNVNNAGPSTNNDNISSPNL